MEKTEGSKFLEQYLNERLPPMPMGSLETEPDGSGFTRATGLEYLQDPLSMSSMMRG